MTHEHQTLIDRLRWAANALQALPPTPVTQQVTDVMRDAAAAFEASPPAPSGWQQRIAAMPNDDAKLRESAEKLARLMRDMVEQNSTDEELADSLEYALYRQALFSSIAGQDAGAKHVAALLSGQDALPPSSSPFPEVSAAQHAFDAGWRSALESIAAPPPGPSDRVRANSYARYVAAALALPPAPEGSPWIPKAAERGREGMPLQANAEADASPAKETP